MVTRRRLVVVLGAAALAPYSSFAQQQTRVWRVGFLSLDTSRSDAGQQAITQFPAALTKLGYGEGRNLVIEWRWADGRTGDLRELAAGLLRAGVDVIVARTNDPIRAAMDATRSIPIVMLNGNSPVETGLIESLARPGGNVTGTAYSSSETIAKALQLLKEIVPRARRVAIPWTNEPQVVRTALDRAAASLDLRLQYFEIRRPEDIAAALEEISSSNVDALWYSGSPILRTRTEQIMAALLKRKLPSIAIIPVFAEQGGLVHYAPDVEEFFERTAGYVDRILKGARPADLPVHQPTKYELVINIKTAKAIGIAIPPAVLVRATRVIE
jgi:putative tryptophan/tyrosine transport system substrate-binding protein